MQKHNDKIAQGQDCSLDPSRRSLLRAGSGLGLGLLAARRVRIDGARCSNAAARTVRRSPAAPALTTADILIETLITWDVASVFGIVGGGINSLIEASRKT